MPKSKPPQFRYTQADLDEECEYCGAKPGQYCHRREVPPLLDPHTIRRRRGGEAAEERVALP
jgi:hypothetical protein